MTAVKRQAGEPSPDRPLRISPRMAEAVIGHLRKSLPLEGCGLISAVQEADAVVAVRFFPGENVDRSPNRFTMDPEQVIEAFTSMRSAGEELGAIVHSHPVSAAEPSPTDIKEWYYPDALNVIVSFRGEPPALRAWRWRPESPSGRFEECGIELVG